MWVLLRPEPVAISTESTRIVVQADGHFNTIIRIAVKVAGFGDGIVQLSRLAYAAGADLMKRILRFLAIALVAACAVPPSRRVQDSSINWDGPAPQSPARTSRLSPRRPSSPWWP